MSTDEHAIDALFSRLRTGDRAALARAITLIESSRPDEQAAARELVRRCLSHRGVSVRYGITGVPGVGKSTLIDVLGLLLIEGGHHVAVLAVDPSSTRSGGSILGDKTRMERLSAHPAAFVRPSPTGGTLGGVARRTQEAIVLCEAAGYDRILIETVGVGQSELTVDRMTDLNLLLMLGGAGDELQGIKRGIMEAADLIAITKTDSGNEARNERAAADLRQAIALLPPRDNGARPAVRLISALNTNSVQQLVEALERTADGMRSSGYTTLRRREQDRWWMRSAIEEMLVRDLYTDARVAEALVRVEQAVLQGEQSPFDAADELLRLFRTASAPRP